MLIFPLFPLAPEQVTGVGFTLNNTNNVLTLTITWDRLFSELPITRYFVNIDGTQHETRVTTLTKTGTPGRTYTIQVIARSAVGFGAWTESVKVARKYIQKSVLHLTMHICRQCMSTLHLTTDISENVFNSDHKIFTVMIIMKMY